MLWNQDCWHQKWQHQRWIRVVRIEEVHRRQIDWDPRSYQRMRNSREASTDCCKEIWFDTLWKRLKSRGSSTNGWTRFEINKVRKWCKSRNQDTQSSQMERIQSCNCRILLANSHIGWVETTGSRLNLFKESWVLEFWKETPLKNLVNFMIFELLEI